MYQRFSLFSLEWAKIYLPIFPATPMDSVPLTSNFLLHSTSFCPNPLQHSVTSAMKSESGLHLLLLLLFIFVFFIKCHSNMNIAVNWRLSINNHLPLALIMSNDSYIFWQAVFMLAKVKIVLPTVKVKMTAFSC